MNETAYNQFHFFDDAKRDRFMEEMEKYSIVSKTGMKVLWKKTARTPIKKELVLLFALRKFIQLPFVRIAPFDKTGDLSRDLVEEILFRDHPYKFGQYNKDNKEIIISRNEEEAQYALDKMYRILENLVDEFYEAFQTGNLLTLEKEKKCYLGAEYYKNPTAFIDRYKDVFLHIKVKNIQKDFDMRTLGDFKSRRFFKLFSTKAFHAVVVEEIFHEKVIHLFKPQRRENAKDLERLLAIFEKSYQSPEAQKFCFDLQQEIESILQAYEQNDKVALADRLNQFFCHDFINRRFFEKVNNPFLANGKRKPSRFDEVVGKLKEIWEASEV